MTLDDRFIARIITGLEPVASVLLAILLAHLLGATNISWAAFAGYAVIRGLASETLTRGVRRFGGTIAGGLLALVIVPLAAPYWPLAAGALFIIGAASIYAALTTHHAYAWLFVGLTFAMVLLDKVDMPGAGVPAFVQTRIIETAAGTFACVVVSLISSATLRRLWPGTASAAPTPVRWHADAARHAVEGGLALATLAILSHWLAIPALAQGAISIMAVMVVPLSDVGDNNLKPVTTRLIHRLIGCALGGAFALVWLLLAKGATSPLIAGTMTGVFIGRWIETGNPAYRYIGFQFAFAVLITLVPDNYAHAEIGPGIERLTGVVIGMLILEPILILSYLLRGKARRSEPETPA